MFFGKLLYLIIKWKVFVQILGLRKYAWKVSSILISNFHIFFGLRASSQEKIHCLRRIKYILKHKQLAVKSFTWAIIWRLWLCTVSPWEIFILNIYLSRWKNNKKVSGLGPWELLHWTLQINHQSIILVKVPSSRPRRHDPCGSPIPLWPRLLLPPVHRVPLWRVRRSL